jgi:hypothetical protein
MKIKIPWIPFLALSASLPNIMWASQLRGTYLYDQLKKPVYKTSFYALFEGQNNLEPWLKGYLKTLNGVDTPVRTRMVGNMKYELYEICQPHNCPRNVLYVLFEPGGTHAWALFTKDDGTSRIFGNPDKIMQAALNSAMHERE